MSNSIFGKDGTAQGVAKQRLIETLAKSDKRVINDPYADRFVMGAGFIKLMGHKPHDVETRLFSQETIDFQKSRSTSVFGRW